MAYCAARDDGGEIVDASVSAANPVPETAAGPETAAAAARDPKGGADPRLPPSLPPRSIWDVAAEVAVAAGPGAVGALLDAAAATNSVSVGGGGWRAATATSTTNETFPSLSESTTNSDPSAVSVDASAAVLSLVRALPPSLPVPSLPARLAAAAARARARGELGRGVALMTEAEAAALGRRLYEGARRAVRGVVVVSQGGGGGGDDAGAPAVGITFGGGGGEGEEEGRRGGEEGAAAARRRRAAAAAARRRQRQRRSSSSGPNADLFSAAASLQPLVGPRSGGGLATTAL